MKQHLKIIIRNNFDQKKEYNYHGIKINQVPMYEYFLNRN